MKIKEFIEALEKNNLLKEYKINIEKINNITYNSKEVIDNTLFICKGFTFKEEYLKEAKGKGATIYLSEVKYNIDMDYIIVSDVRCSMALLSILYYKLEKPLCKIGITGTKGKTTTVYFINSCLNKFYNKRTPYISTIDYYTGLSYNESINTTPESLDLNKYFKEMEDSNNDICVMEVSSQAEKLNRIYGLTFDYGAFLNIGIDHISKTEHENFDDYLNCKINFLKKCKNVYVYKETDYFDRIDKELNGKFKTFGSDLSCDYVLKDIKHFDDFTSFKVNDLEYKIKLKGDFNCVNACCCIAILTDIGVPYNTIKEGLYETTVPGRMEFIKGFKCPIIVDYAHNKLSIINVCLEIKNEYKNYNLKLVMGLPGGKAVNRRKELGEVAPKYFKKVYLTKDHPNYESVYDICNEVVSYFDKKIDYEIIEDRKMAIHKAMDEAQSNDVILVLGKGSEDYQLEKGVHVPYETDKVVVLNYIKEMTK